MKPLALAHLAARLRAIGFTDAIIARLGAIGSPGWMDAATKAFDHWSPDPALKWAIRALILGEFVPTVEITRALTEPGLGALREAGLLDAAAPANTTRVAAMIVPMAGTLSASDRPPQTVFDPPAEFVLPIGNATALLADLSPRVSVEVAVDLGVGQGFLSALMARHARRVIATDVNPRALHLTACTAAMSGALEKIEFREGDLLEPLKDLSGRVGLLACNPPFIIAAQGAGRAISNQGDTPDGLLERLVRGAPGLLQEGGYAVMLGLWHHPEPKDWSARPRAWLGGAGCDAMVLRGSTMTPGEYYTQWIAGSSASPTSREEWSAVCARHGIGGVTFGALIVRKRKGENWLRAQGTPLRQAVGPASAVITRIFAAQTALMDPARAERLLDSVLKGADNLRLMVDQQNPTGEAHLIHQCSLTLPMGVHQSIHVLLAGLDGQRPARACLADLASRGDLPTPVDDPRLLKLIQQLVLSGFVEMR